MRSDEILRPSSRARTGLKIRRDRRNHGEDCARATTGETAFCNSVGQLEETFVSPSLEGCHRRLPPFFFLEQRCSVRTIFFIPTRDGTCVRMEGGTAEIYFATVED